MGGKNALSELLDAREVIELGAMKFIFANITKQDIKELGIIFRQMDTTLKNSQHDEYAQKDLEFHLRLIEASHNRFLRQTFEHLRGFTKQFITEGYRLKPKVRKFALEEHRLILDSLIKRDNDAAYSHVEDHIRQRKKRFIKF